MVQRSFEVPAQKHMCYEAYDGGCTHTVVPADAVAEIGEDLELQCLITGELFEEASLVWSVSGTPLEIDGEKYQTNDMNNTLVIYNVGK